nr:transcription-associated protein 1-like isoform X3 [Parasteatoda tepidariorum]
MSIKNEEESKLKALPELSGELETIISDPQYPSFLDQAIKIFIRILGDEEPQFIAEKTTHVCIFMSCQWIILYILICKMRKTLVVFRIIIEFHKATMQCGGAIHLSTKMLNMLTLCMHR